MTKKIFPSTEKSRLVHEIVGWKPPVFHQASECYVSVSAFDPAIGRMHVKKIMLGHIKGKKAQKMYGEALVKRLTEKLMQGWNPWVELVNPREYSSFNDVADKYREYLLKMCDEDSLRQETVTSYFSRLRILQNWMADNNVKVFYTYQFDKNVVGQFLDYIFVDRNNTLRTRNNYLTWIKSFCRYLLDRGYVPSDPSAEYSCVKKRGKVKDRDIIPDDILQDLHDYLESTNRFFLLACYMLHYVFVRPKEMSYLKVGDFSIRNQTLRLYGNNTKNRCDAVVTLPQKVLKLMIDLKVFDSPGNYYLFSEGFRPGPDRRSEKAFRDYWHHHVRKDLGLTDRYKFYSLKDTGITNMLKANTDILTVRDQARHSSVLITDIYTPKDIMAANHLLLNYHGVL